MQNVLLINRNSPKLYPNILRFIGNKIFDATYKEESAKLMEHIFSLPDASI